MVNGASNLKGSDIGVHLKSLNNKVIEQSFQLGARRLKVQSDSHFIVNQVLGKYTAKDPRMESYLAVMHSLKAHFDKYTIQQLPRNLNAQADALASFGLTFEMSLRQTIPIGYIEKLSIELGLAIATKANVEDWRTPIIAYFRDGLLPKDEYEAHKIRTKGARFYSSTVHNIDGRSTVPTLVALMSRKWPTS